MRGANAVGRLQLKSKLLIGVAGLAAAGSSAAMAADPAAPAPDPKWMPYADIGGGVGDSFTQGRVTLFAPVWQDLDSLLFVRVGAGTQTHNDEMFNLGAGYRTKIDPEWILGLFAGFDNTHTDAGHNFSRLSLGAELMSADWDARINGYSAKRDPQILPSSFEFFIQDTHIGILQEQEAAYSGFDGEIGYRVFHTDNTDVRLFAGGFIFHNTHHVISSGGGVDFDFKYPSMSGPRGRAEVNIFDLDVLGSQSRVSFDGEISHDKIRGTTGFAGATLRIPLGAVSGQGGQMLDDLDRRMADPVRRSDNVMTALQFNRPEPVIIYNGTITSEPTNTLYYVDNSLGHGSYADPTTLKDATDRGPVNQFVVLTDQEGPVDATGTHVQAGESVVGPGVFQIRGVNSGLVFTHDFAPGSGPVTLTSSDPNVITLDPNTNLFGFTIGGPFTNAIYGHNINDVVIGNVTIDGNGTGENGILINQDQAGPADVSIYNTTIEDVTNDGIQINVTNDTGDSSTFNLMLTDLTIDAGHDGVGVNSDTTGGSTTTVYAGVHDSTITGGASDVILIGSSSGGSTLHQTLVVDPTILNAGDYGILVGAYSDGGTLTQDVLISDVTINDVTNSGIYIYAYGVDGATIHQNVTMNNVTVHGNFSKDEGGDDAPPPASINAAAVEIGGYAYGNLITLGAASKFDATVTQTFNLTNVTANEAYYDNIRIEAYAGYGGITHQYGTLSTVTANDAIYGNGISIVGYAANGGHVIQRATLSDVTANNNKYDGIGVFGRARIITEAGIQAQFAEQEIDSTLAAQYITIHNANASGNNYAGLEAGVSTRGDAAALQQLSVTGSTFDSNEYGVEASSYASNGGSSQQLVSLTGSTARYNDEDGVAFGVVTYAEGFAAQTVYIDNLTATHNDGDGAHFAAIASYGGDSEQNVYLYDSALSHNNGDGLAITTEVNGYDYGQVEGTYYYSHVSQNVIAAYDAMSHNDGSGVRITNSVEYGGQLNQFIYLYEDTMVGNGGDGVRESTNVITTGYYEGTFGLPTAAYADLYVVDSVANKNGEAGIHITSSLTAPSNPELVLGYSYLVQNIVVSGTDASANTESGFSDSVSDTGLLTFSAHYVTIDNSTFDHNGADGALFNAYQNFGPGSFGAAIQQVSISDSDFSLNTDSGLAGIAEATGFQGRAQQNFIIQDSTFDNNFGSGISLYRHAHDGVYYSYTGEEYTYGYPCTQVQGLYGGCAFVRQTVQISGSDISNNRDDGIYLKTVADNYGAVYTGLAVDDNGTTYRAQVPTLLILGSTVDNNRGDGLDVQSDVGAGSYLYQYVVGAFSSFDGNHGDGIYIGNEVHDGGIVGSYRTYEGEGGTYTEPYPGSKLTLYSSSASNNRGDGINLYNNVDANQVFAAVHADQAETYPSLLYQYVQVINSHIDNNRMLGIEANNYVGGGSSLLQTILLYSYNEEGPPTAGEAGTTVDGNQRGGILIRTGSTGYTEYGFSLGVSQLIAYNADISNNLGDGIAVGTQATNGGHAGNLVVLAFSDVYGNHGDGVVVSAEANSNATTADTGVAQYVHVIGSYIAHNQDYGINIRGRALGAYAITDQYLGLVGSTVNSNGRGVSAFEIAYGASAANQTLYFAADRINNNLGDGVYAASIAVGQSFTEQTVNFTYNTETTTDITGNGDNGIDVSAAAFSGSDAEQNIFVYYVNASNNGGNGLSVGSGANGYGFGSSYIYYSHVGQNLVAAYSTFDHNHNDGVSVSNVTYYGGVLNQLVELYDVQATHNRANGFYMTSHQTTMRGNSFSFSTNLYSDVYLINSTFDHNVENGISLNSYTYGPQYHPAFFGGYSYLIQHVQVSGTSASYNHASGLLLNANQEGRYSLNGQYLTLSDSTFNQNVGDGARLLSTSDYGPGSFGDTFEQIAIDGSSFSGNGENGLALRADASGNQGRAEQHVTVGDSTFNRNHGDGVSIYSSATDGVYVTGHPCTSAQGLAGGCAFVRQDVVIQYSDINHNGGDGVSLTTYANNYGAIYGATGRPHQPTLELYGVTVDGNGSRGMNVSNHVSGNSYLYQYVAMTDSTLDHNASDGVYSASYVGGGSTMLQRVLLYSYHTGASSSYNAGNGFKSSIEALGGSYARDVNIVEGVDLSHDGAFGFDGAVAYADGSSTGLQINAVYFNTMNHNGDGFGLYSIGSGAQQISYFGDNEIRYNSFVGAYGEANFGAFQYIGIYTFGNTVDHNGTDYLFNSFGGSTQILN